MKPGPKKFDLQKAKDWADFILKVVSVLAIAAGGSWAYYQFRLADTTASNIQLSVSTEVLKYTDDYRLLLIHVRPKNIGKVPVTPGADGLVVTVYKFPDNEKPGPIQLDKLSAIYKTDVLKKYTDGYVLEPGVEYDEIVALLLPKNEVIMASAVMDLGEQTEIDQSHLVRIE